MSRDMPVVVRDDSYLPYIEEGDDRPHFNREPAIEPVGYKNSRLFLSENSVSHCFVLDAMSGEKFGKQKAWCQRSEQGKIDPTRLLEFVSERQPEGVEIQFSAQ